MLRQKKQSWRMYFLLLFFLLNFQNFPAAKEIADEKISNAIDNELMYNSSVPSYWINVETNEGIVILSGSENDILARERAVKIARTVKGSRVVVNQIQVDVPFLKAAVLERGAADALMYDPAKK